VVKLSVSSPWHSETAHNRALGARHCVLLQTTYPFTALTVQGDFSARGQQKLMFCC